MKRFAALLAVALLFTPGCRDLRTPTEQAAQWWPASEQATARCIIHLESNGDPSTVGAAGELGVLQIHPVHAREFEALTGKSFHPWAADSPLNGEYGYALWLSSGRSWKPWSTHRRCGV